VLTAIWPCIEACSMTVLEPVRNTQGATINLADDRLKVVSFDVFDTVIARRCGAPETIFRIVGERLRERRILAFNAADFEHARIGAERRLRRSRGAREITLKEIYVEMNCLWLFPDAMVEEMIASELEAERENLFAIPGAQTMVQTARGAGRRIVFVSDMYLPETFLRSVLTELELLAKGDGLYVSSSWGKSKAHGELYGIVLDRERVGPREMVHIGDSFRVDYLKAKQAGIRSVHYARGALNRFEARLAQVDNETSDGCPTLGGISRLARLAADEQGAHAVAARLGASLAGPVLTLYAEWVLRSARSRKLERLYFLARDGQALLRLCEILAPALGAARIDLRYLYGSREVWCPAALEKLDETAAAFFAAHVAFAASTREECLELLGFEADEVRGLPVSSGWAGFKADAQWKRRVFLDLAADSTWGPILKTRLQKRAALTARYLREQGLADGGRYGLVDCGWSGTWTDLLGDLLEAQGVGRPLVFFIGQRKRSTPSRSQTLAFLFDHQDGGGLNAVPDYLHIVVEFLLTADHGRTQGFQELQGRLSPRLAAIDWQGFDPAEWRVFRAALLGFARIYSNRLQSNGRVPEVKSALSEVITLFWERPSVEEATFFAGHTIGLSPSGTARRPLARPYQLADAIQLATRLKLPGYPPFWWHPGAQVLSQPPTRTVMGLIWELLEQARHLREVRKGKSDAVGGWRRCATLAGNLKRTWQRRYDHELLRFEGGRTSVSAQPHERESVLFV
jgi:FMN phosphatase YigB (HAD superfamily)